jgi:hypothetical protein
MEERRWLTIWATIDSSWSTRSRPRAPTPSHPLLRLTGISKHRLITTGDNTTALWLTSCIPWQLGVARTMWTHISAPSRANPTSRLPTAMEIKQRHNNDKDWRHTTKKQLVDRHREWHDITHGTRPTPLDSPLHNPIQGHELLEQRQVQHHDDRRTNEPPQTPWDYPSLPGSYYPLHQNHTRERTIKRDTGISTYIHRQWLPIIYSQWAEAAEWGWQLPTLVQQDD